MEGDESFADCAVRETVEEAGVAEEDISVVAEADCIGNLNNRRLGSRTRAVTSGAAGSLDARFMLAAPVCGHRAWITPGEA